MSTRTIFLARLFGLYCLLQGLSMAVHKQATIEMVNGLVHNPSMLFIAGLIALSIGLAMVLGHNIWSGGTLPIVVTLIGWLSLIKGLLIWFLPQQAACGIVGGIHYQQLFHLSTAIALILGLYLTYGGFRAKAR